MTWQEDPEGRMIVLILGLIFAGIVLMCATAFTSVLAFVMVVAMLTLFIMALVFVP